MAGETTTDLVTTTTPLYTSKSVGALIVQTSAVELRTTDLATNDITAVCRVPKGATVVGIALATDDLDSNGSEALVWSIYVGSTLFKAGITNAVALAGTFVTGVTGPVTVTADTYINLKATTAAGTAAGGTCTITPFYTTSE